MSTTDNHPPAKETTQSADFVYGKTQFRTDVVRPQKLGDQVARVLRRMILVGELRPGATTQEQLAMRLGVSTMPIREALLRLAAEGFIQAMPNRSFSVLPITRDDIRDVYWIHAKIAGELTARACSKVDEGTLAALRHHEESYLRLGREGSLVEMERANWEFHGIINSLANSPKLMFLLRTSLRYVPDGFYGLVPEWVAASERGHEEILAAFEKGNPEASREAAQAHVEEAGELLIKHFSATGYWTMPTGQGT